MCFAVRKCHGGIGLCECSVDDYLSSFGKSILQLVGSLCYWSYKVIILMMQELVWLLLQVLTMHGQHSEEMHGVCHQFSRIFKLIYLHWGWRAVCHTSGYCAGCNCAQFSIALQQEYNTSKQTQLYFKVTLHIKSHAYISYNSNIQSCTNYKSVSKPYILSHGRNYIDTVCVCIFICIHKIDNNSTGKYQCKQQRTQWNQQQTRLWQQQ